MTPEPGSYFTCSNAIGDHLRTLSGAAVKVYVLLSGMADGDSLKCWPSHQTIAAAIGMTDRTVRNALAELIDAGLISMTNRGRHSSVYEMLYPETSFQLSDDLTGNQFPDKPDLTGSTVPDKPLTGNLFPNNRKPISDRTNLINQEDTSCPDSSSGSRKLSDASKPKKTKRPFTDEDLKAATWIWDKIRVAFPRHKKPDLDKWAKAVRLARTEDGRTHRELCEVFSWAHQDEFWKANILCPDSLRKQFDKLFAKMESERSKASSQQLIPLSRKCTVPPVR